MIKDPKNNTTFHETLKKISIVTYPDRSKEPIDGFRLIDSRENKKTGFYSRVYTNEENEIVIAYGGSDPHLKNVDWNNNIAMRQRHIPAQATDALALHDEIKRKYPDKKIYITGYSLGGSLGSIVSGLRRTLAINFNPYGVGDMFKDRHILKTDNIVNYVNINDPLTMDNAENHLGEVRKVEQKQGYDGFPHFLESFDTFDKATPLTREDITNFKSHLGYKIFDSVVGGGIKLRETAINAKKISIDIANKAKKTHHNGSNLVSDYHKTPEDNTHYCSGYHHVKGYTRSDGTEVHDYPRKCGYDHYGDII